MEKMIFVPVNIQLTDPCCFGLCNRTTNKVHRRKVPEQAAQS
jgi:hypothetical protein